MHLNIAYHLYQLKFRASCSNVGPMVRHGALLRITFDDGLIGYCDCHPWTELGDLPLHDQLSALKQSIPTPLLNCSLRFARLDAEARYRQHSLFDNLTIPPSHQLSSFSDNLQSIFTENISIFKLKAGRNPSVEIPTMFKWLTQNPEIKFRLDFNEMLSRQEFQSYMYKMPSTVKLNIDYIEDPYVYDPQAYSEDQKDFKIPFAVDRNADKACEFPASAKYIVLKPAVNLLPATIPSSMKIVVTTYLDHPFGQMCAAYSAAKLKEQHPSKVDNCGLLTHKCYQSDPFIELIQTQGSNLLPSKGTGFGFDTLLKEIPWQILK